MAGATVIIHAAGWLEGGLPVSYEKFITDMEAVQMVAEMCRPVEIEGDALALAALDEVGPSGHFFGCAHTMARYQTEFYEPLVGDWSNFGTWSERGEKDASTRATELWQRILDEDARPELDGDRVEALRAFIDRRTAEGGAPPES
jgi:trimethylamine--corrinoid protein Co-methyltransferase